MRLLPGSIGVVLLSLAAGGCSHGTISEIPTAPAPTITKLTVTPVGGGILIEGISVPVTSSGGFPTTGATLGAFAEYNNGTGKYVVATWTSSDTNVVTIDGTTLTAKGRGTAIITAAAEGMTAKETFVVQGGIAGTWSGNAIVEQCGADSGALGEIICFPPNQGRTPGTLAVGVTLPFSLVITKSGTDLQAVAQVGDVHTTLTGTDRGQNFLTLTGEAIVGRNTIKFVYWDTRARDETMEGLIGFEVRDERFPGHAEVVARLDKVMRR